MADLTIKGIQEAQRWNLRAIAALKPGGMMGRAVQYALVDLQRYAVTITHVDTGSLRASHRMAYSEGFGLYLGRIFIDPNSINPRSRMRPADYGAAEEARGGSHAFYERTIRERVPATVNRLGQEIGAALT